MTGSLPPAHRIAMSNRLGKGQPSIHAGSDLFNPLIFTTCWSSWVLSSLFCRREELRQQSRVTCLLPGRFSPFLPLSGAKDPTFSRMKDLTGSQLKEGLPLDESRFSKEGFEVQVALEWLSLHLSQDSLFSRSHPCFMSFRQIQLSPNNSWIKSAGSCSSSAQRLLFLLQEEWSSINCVTCWAQ